jgi:hypothetical protein
VSSRTRVRGSGIARLEDEIPRSGRWFYRRDELTIPRPVMGDKLGGRSIPGHRLGGGDFLPA